MLDINKAKSLVISSVMKDPALFKSLQEGLQAPIGSSKRDKAKSILKSLSIANQIPMQDGQGGPGYILPGQTSFDPNATSTPSSQLNLSTSTSQSANLPTNTTYNPNTGQMEQIDKTVSQPQQQQDLSKLTATSDQNVNNKLLFIPPAPTPAIKSTDSPVDKTLNKLANIQSLNDLANSGAAWITPGDQAILKLFKDKPEQIPDEFVNRLIAARDARIKKPVTTTGKTTANQDQSKPTLESQTPEYRQSLIDKYVKGGYSLDEATKSVDSLLGGGTRNLPQLTTGTTIQQPTGQDISDTISAYATGDTQRLIDMINSNPSKTLFIQQFENDKELMKQYFPGLSDGELPLGASLAQSTNSLFDALDNEYGLTQQLDRINQLRSDGYNVSSDIESYIRGKDTYLKQLDGLEKKATDRWMEISTGDPETDKMMGNYMNYLTILKGRTNQRYANYLKDAVTEYQNNFKNEVDLYNSKVAQFNQEFGQKSALLAEDYNKMDTALGEIYDSVKNADQANYEATKNALELQKLGFEVIKAANDAGTNSNSINAYLKNKTYFDNLITNTGASETVGKSELFNGDLGAVLQTAADEGQNTSAALQPIFKQMRDNSQALINGDKANNSTVDKYWKNYADVINSFYNNYNSTVDENGNNVQVPDVVNGAKSLADSLIASFEEQYSQKLASNPAELQAVKNAITDLVGSKGWFKKSPTADEIRANKAKWVEAHKSEVPEVVLQAIYAQAMEIVNPNDFSNLMDVFTTVGYGDQKQNLGSLDNLSSAQISDSITRGLRAQFPLAIQ